MSDALPKNFRWTGTVGILIGGLLIAGCAYAEANKDAGAASIISILFKWSPLLLSGFVFNLLMSSIAMAVGTFFGIFLGFGQISRRSVIRNICYYVTHFFRNAPWLVLLFYAMFLIPFQLKIFGAIVRIPDWVKATIGLSVPVMANVSEIVRGAVQSVPSGQWESGAALAFKRGQILRLIILPQCFKRMLPPWMNLYSIVTTATVLAAIVGVSEVMTLANDVLGAENRPDLLLPIYGLILLMFFTYCYPIALWTAHLERKFGQYDRPM